MTREQEGGIEGGRLGAGRGRGLEWGGVGWGEIARADLTGEGHKAPFCPSSNTPFPPFH